MRRPARPVRPALPAARPDAGAAHPDVQVLPAMSRRSLLGAAGASLLLSACGGGSSDDVSWVRFLNASVAYGSLDCYLEGTRHVQALAYGAASAYVELDAGTYTTAFKRASASTTLLSTDRGFSADTHYTVVTYGWDGALKSALLTDEEDAPDTGSVKLRVFNTSTDAGSVDVLLGDTGADIADANVIASGVAGATATSYVEVGTGTWQLSVTGNGDRADLRLEIPSLTLADRSVVTVILAPTAGGTLVRAIVVVQQGEATVHEVTLARVRLVSDVSGNATVSAAVGGRTLATATSPAVGSYVLVNAGTQLVTTTVNGTAGASGSVVIGAGADLTLMVHGGPASSAYTVISDDNRLPTNTANAKLRLVHGINGLASTVTLQADYSALAADVAFASASSYAGVAATTSALLEVYSALSATPLYAKSDLTLVAKGIYTVFVLGTAAVPTGLLRRDR